MSIIKSALEIALEKASKIEVDPAKIKNIEIENKSGFFANKLMNDDQFDLEKELKEYSKDEKAMFCAYIQKILIGNLNLSTFYNEETINNILSGLKKIKAKPSKIDSIGQDLHYILSSYSQQLKQVYENLKSQFRSQMAQMKEKMGMEMQIEPEQLPEFQKHWNQTKESIDGQFKTHLEQLKKSISGLKNLYQ